jgi:hypothetical protein
VAAFTKSQGEFEFVLPVPTAVGADEANLKLVTDDERTAEINQRWETPTPLLTHSPNARCRSR